MESSTTGVHISSGENLDQLRAITLEEPESTLMPPFSMIREFMFDGLAFQTLKDNVKSFARPSRYHLEELSEFITKYIHPPGASSAALLRRQEYHRILREVLRVFLAALEKEAVAHNISATDRAGIKNVQGELSQFTTRVTTFWVREVPSWHFYPLVPVSDTTARVQSNLSSTEDIEWKPDFEAFEAFVCSSSAFLHLVQSISMFPDVPWETYREKGLSWGSSLFYNWGKNETPSLPHKTAISFECVSTDVPFACIKLKT
jgi:hypothetical protein